MRDNIFERFLDNSRLNFLSFLRHAISSSLGYRRNLFVVDVSKSFAKIKEITRLSSIEPQPKKVVVIVVVLVVVVVFVVVIIVGNKYLTLRFGQNWVNNK